MVDVGSIVSAINIEKAGKDFAIRHNLQGRDLGEYLGFDPIDEDKVYDFIYNKYNDAVMVKAIKQMNSYDFESVTDLLYKAHRIGHLKSIKRMNNTLNTIRTNMQHMKNNRMFLLHVSDIAVKFTIVMTVLNHGTKYHKPYDKTYALVFKICYQLFQSDVEICGNCTKDEWISKFLVLYAASGSRIIRSYETEPVMRQPRTTSDLLAKRTSDACIDYEDIWLRDVAPLRATLATLDDMKSMAGIVNMIWKAYVDFRNNYI